jgi:hypothetical protein
MVEVCLACPYVPARAQPDVPVSYPRCVAYFQNTQHRGAEPGSWPGRRRVVAVAIPNSVTTRPFNWLTRFADSVAEAIICALETLALYGREYAVSALSDLTPPSTCAAALWWPEAKLA